MYFCNTKDFEMQEYLEGGDIPKQIVPYGNEALVLTMHREQTLREWKRRPSFFL